LKMIVAEGARVGRRRSAVVAIRKHLAGLYRGFVWWASLYGEVDDHYEKERRELVLRLHDELSNKYLPRSVWLTEGSRKKVENFLRMSEELCSEFSAENRGARLPAGQTQHGEAREQEVEAAQDGGRVRTRNRACGAPQSGVAPAPAQGVATS
jgi:hypothetical protein